MSEDSNNNLLQKLIGLPADFLEWVKDQLGEDLVCREVIRDLGLEPDKDKPCKFDLPEGSMDSISRYRKSAKPDEAASREVMREILTIVEALKAFEETFEEAESVEDGAIEAVKEAAHHLLNVLAFNYIRIRYPLVYWIGQPLGFIEESHKGIGLLLKNVFAPLFPGSFKFNLKTEDDAKTSSNLTFLPLGVLVSFGEKLPFVKRLIKKKDMPDQLLYGWDSRTSNRRDD